MGLKDDIQNETDSIFTMAWTRRAGYVVPVPKDIGLESNDGVDFAAGTVLYADLAASTQMVDSMKDTLSAEIYKAFLAAAARVIREEGGEITAYDGDRVMAVFLGDSQCSTAARCGLKINWAVKNIVQPSLRTKYPQSAPKHEIKHRVGIDKSAILVARTGVRGGNDLVWVGRAPNYAAKLSAQDDVGYYTFITKKVFDSLSEASKYGGDPKRLMWEERAVAGLTETTVYRSSWWWSIA